MAKDAETKQEPASDIKPEKPDMAWIESAEDLREAFPELVAEIKAAVVEDIGKASVEQVKENMPDVYDKIALDVQNKSAPRQSGPGFLLEYEDPFADGALRTFMRLKGVAGLRLPFVILYKEKGKADVNKLLVKKEFDKSERIKAEFKDLKAFVASKSLVAVQTLESYILRAKGGGDHARADKARRAMKKFK